MEKNKRDYRYEARLSLQKRKGSSLRTFFVPAGLTKQLPPCSGLATALRLGAFERCVHHDEVGLGACCAVLHAVARAGVEVLEEKARGSSGDGIQWLCHRWRQRRHGAVLRLRQLLLDGHAGRGHAAGLPVAAAAQAARTWRTHAAGSSGIRQPCRDADAAGADRVHVGRPRLHSALAPGQLVPRRGDGGVRRRLRQPRLRPALRVDPWQGRAAGACGSVRPRARCDGDLQGADPHGLPECAAGGPARADVCQRRPARRLCLRVCNLRADVVCDPGDPDPLSQRASPEAGAPCGVPVRPLRALPVGRPFGESGHQQRLGAGEQGHAAAALWLLGRLHPRPHTGVCLRGFGVGNGEGRKEGRGAPTGAGAEGRRGRGHAGQRLPSAAHTRRRCQAPSDEAAEAIQAVTESVVGREDCCQLRDFGDEASFRALPRLKSGAGVDRASRARAWTSVHPTQEEVEKRRAYSHVEGRTKEEFLPAPKRAPARRSASARARAMNAARLVLRFLSTIQRIYPRIESYHILYMVCSRIESNDLWPATIEIELMFRQGSRARARGSCDGWTFPPLSFQTCVKPIERGHRLVFSA
eukprot:scaffold5204_cov296-Pinguiococcus_pyrenoidosus.AAC.4